MRSLAIPAKLSNHIGAETLRFVRLARRLYAGPSVLGVRVEIMSVDWMQALAMRFRSTSRSSVTRPYFEECFSQQVEERHAAESLAVTQMVLRAQPALVSETLRDARAMAEALDGVWRHLDRIVRRARRLARGPRVAPDERVRTPAPCRGATFPPSGGRSPNLSGRSGSVAAVATRLGIAARGAVPLPRPGGVPRSPDVVPRRCQQPRA